MPIPVIQDNQVLSAIQTNEEHTGRRHPDWLKVRLPGGENFVKIKSMMRTSGLHTVCEEARCPNLAECWRDGTATFLILGDVCTRWCGFCNIKHGKPNGLDMEEPKRVAQRTKDMGLDYVVITSVNRDDLEDGGAGVFAGCIEEIRRAVPCCKIELLIPDFDGNFEALRTVVEAKPEVLAHNIETSKRLHPFVRPKGRYERALEVLKKIKEFDKNMTTKSNIMAGLGEREEEIMEIMRDLISVDCDLLTIGQYLRPAKQYLPVKKYYHPSEFARFREIGMQFGFKHVEAGPLVRSSYHAKRQENKAALSRELLLNTKPH